MKILFVCTGNTCRSPMAQGIMQAKLNERGIKDIEVESAGVATLGGDAVSPNAVEAVKKYNADISNHRSRQISKYLLDESDLIIGMTQSHIDALKPYVNENKLRVLGDGIPDPYGGDLRVYEICAASIAVALDCLLNELAGS